jgi:hypothetical protein|tara:strand:- start:16064 stop:16540 length:477 start_codon:yes stop_codon:yes gene_type:complete
MAVTKRFDRELYDKADKLAKKVITKHLVETGYDVTEEPVRGKVDLVAMHQSTGDSKYVEVEMKYAWKDTWNETWKDVRIPYRKKKLIDKYTDKDDYGRSCLDFYVLNYDATKAWVISADIIEKYGSVVEVSNKYVRKGEQFYSIPVDKIYTINLSGDN